MLVRVVPGRQDHVVQAAGAVVEEEEEDGRLRMDLRFADRAHATSVLWSLLPDVTVLAPEELRAEFAARLDAARAGLAAGTVSRRTPR